ncbi:hypothetical protein [Pedosphaera parvula]|uniref:Uncharacterized protein n=1 Tax=Pedosphaera parvula (strain Ellin514) TaxID=320771 RepID=B9XS44_PEDPL|nr:hypothetical protein [Pedosphaera parvula]EEF57340.1 hypothetical protein Cflav_PD0455 [Pedosphaera parvula Ellin514]
MNTSPEEFEQLRKLLKLKRYEQPPPRYFKDFSAQVLRRLEQESSSISATAEVSWFKRIFGVLDTSPVAAGVFGVSVCSLLLGGIVFTQWSDGVGGDAIAATTEGNLAFAQPTSNPMLERSLPVSSHSGLSINSDGFFNAPTPGNSLGVVVQPVNFTTAQ